MDSITNIITNLQYVAEDEGLRKSSALILEQTKQIEELTKERTELSQKQAQLTAKDIEQQRQIAARIREVDQLIKQKTKSVIQERVANADLNKELVKELGYLGNLEQRITALKNQRAFADNAKDVKRLTAEIDKLDNEMRGLLTTTKSGGGALSGFLGSIMQGFGLGAGAFTIDRAVSALTTNLKEAVAEYENAYKQASRLEGILDNMGQSQNFESYLNEAKKLSEVYSYIDNDDIIQVQQQLLTYGKVTRKEISQLLPIIIDFSAKSGKSLEESASAVIGALEGQGREFKRWGLNLRDAESFTERFAIVTEDLGKKVEGYAQKFAQSSEGLKATARKEINDVLESYGEAASKIEIFYKSAVAGLYLLIKDLTTSSKEARNQFVDSVKADAKAFADELSEEDLKLQQRQAKMREADIRAGEERIKKLREKMKNAGTFGGDRQAYEEAIKVEEEQIIKNRETINAVNEASRTFQLRKQKEAEEKKRVLEERFAEERKKQAEDAAKRAEEERKKAEEKRKQEEAKARADYLNAQKQFLDEEAKNRLSAMDYELLKLEEHFTVMKDAYKKVGADIAALVQLEEEKKRQIRDKYALEDYKQLVERETARRKAAKEAAQKEGPVTGEFIPGMSGDVSTEGLAPSAFSADVTANGYKDTADSIKSSNQEIIESFYQVNEVIQAVGNTLNDAYNASIQRLNLETEAQQNRIDRAKKYAERGGAELLEIEEARLDKLNQKRQEFAQQQLIINNALALSNAILAVATAAGETGVGAVAAVPAVLAVIAAGYALATSLTEPQSFAEGTKAVKGPGTETSDSIPARLSVNERVMKASTSKKFKRILDDIQDERFVNEHQLLAEIRGGRYGGPSLDYQGILGSKNTSSTGMTDKLLMTVNSKLDAVRETIADKPVGMLSADENGLRMWYVKMQKLENKRNNY